MKEAKIKRFNNRIKNIGKEISQVIEEPSLETEANTTTNNTTENVSNPSTINDEKKIYEENEKSGKISNIRLEISTLINDINEEKISNYDKRIFSEKIDKLGERVNKAVKKNKNEKKVVFSYSNTTQEDYANFLLTQRAINEMFGDDQECPSKDLYRLSKCGHKVNYEKNNIIRINGSGFITIDASKIDINKRYSINIHEINEAFIFIDENILKCISSISVNRGYKSIIYVTSSIEGSFYAKNFEKSIIICKRVRQVRLHESLEVFLAAYVLSKSITIEKCKDAKFSQLPEWISKKEGSCWDKVTDFDCPFGTSTNWKELLFPFTQEEINQIKTGGNYDIGREMLDSVFE